MTRTIFLANLFVESVSAILIYSTINSGSRNELASTLNKNLRSGKVCLEGLWRE